jgi:hypothetical protein
MGQVVVVIVVVMMMIIIIIEGRCAGSWEYIE